MAHYKGSITGDSHTAEGIRLMGAWLKQIYIERFTAAAQAMFVWEDSTGSCDSMFELSCFTAPERFLIENIRVALFKYGGETHCLPVAGTSNVNMYGYQNHWQVVASGTDKLSQDLNGLQLDTSNSVLILNSLRGTYDWSMIHIMVNNMVDGLLTLYQRGLLARAPFVFTTDGFTNDGDVSSYMNAIFNYQPWIVRNVNGSLLQVDVNDVNVVIDPALQDMVTMWESRVLAYLGYNATDIHKRAQQSVPETMMTQDIIRARRYEKWRCRQKACDKFNDKMHTKIKVHSVLDEWDGLDNSAIDQGRLPGDGFEEQTDGSE